jgi:hypothetical protein
MPRSPRMDFPDAVYHLTTRGNGRADIFFSDDDRQRLLAQLSHHLQQMGIVLYAYGLDAAILKTHGRHAGVVKAVAVALASRLANLRPGNREHYRIGSSAIGAIHRRLAERPEALEIVESLATQLRRKRIKYKA